MFKNMQVSFFTSYIRHSLIPVQIHILWKFSEVFFERQKGRKWEGIKCEGIGYLSRHGFFGGICEATEYPTCLTYFFRLPYHFQNRELLSISFPSVVNIFSIKKYVYYFCLTL